MHLDLYIDSLYISFYSDQAVFFSYGQRDHYWEFVAEYFFCIGT